ncbi:MAG: lysyl oxidase family protein [Anaerolineales bacterium]
MFVQLVRRLHLILVVVTGFSEGTEPPFSATPLPARRPPSVLPTTAPFWPGEFEVVETPETVQWQLPDLRTRPPTDFEIQRFSKDRRVLRLANTVWNGGVGTLELHGVLNHDTHQTDVIQRVSTADGEHVDYFVGAFVWHPTHDHWHVGEFAVYELWQLTAAGELDRVVAQSDKLSYCLIDTDVVAPKQPGFDPQRRYYGCGRTRQGLSVGWGDKYDSFLDGQSLDVSALADGVYALVSTTNPNARLLEADYTNNTAIVYLNLAGDRVAVVPSPELAPAQCQAAGRC